MFYCSKTFIFAVFSGPGGRSKYWYLHTLWCSRPPWAHQRPREPNFMFFSAAERNATRSETTPSQAEQRKAKQKKAKPRQKMGVSASAARGAGCLRPRGGGVARHQVERGDAAWCLEPRMFRLCPPGSQGRGHLRN